MYFSWDGGFEPYNNSLVPKPGGVSRNTARHLKISQQHRNDNNNNNKKNKTTSAFFWQFVKWRIDLFVVCGNAMARLSDCLKRAILCDNLLRHSLINCSNNCCNESFQQQQQQTIAVYETHSI